MSKMRIAFFAVIGILASGMTAFAQVTETAGVAADNQFTQNKFKAIAAAAVEGAARNPGAAGRIQTMMILGLALIESLVLFALLVVFVKVT